MYKIIKNIPNVFVNMQMRVSFHYTYFFLISIILKVNIFTIFMNSENYTNLIFYVLFFLNKIYRFVITKTSTYIFLQLLCINAANNHI